MEYEDLPEDIPNGGIVMAMGPDKLLFANRIGIIDYLQLLEMDEVVESFSVEGEDPDRVKASCEGLIQWVVRQLTFFGEPKCEIHPEEGQACGELKGDGERIRWTIDPSSGLGVFFAVEDLDEMVESKRRDVLKSNPAQVKRAAPAFKFLHELFGTMIDSSRGRYNEHFGEEEEE